VPAWTATSAAITKLNICLHQNALGEVEATENFQNR
jgi:hypothetical protein